MTDFHVFRGVGAYILKGQPAAPIETFARFQAGFWSSEDFHRFLSIFIDFNGFSWVFIDFGEAAHPTRVPLLPLSWMASSAGFGLLAVQVRLRPVFHRSARLSRGSILLVFTLSLILIAFHVFRGHGVTTKERV